MQHLQVLEVPFRRRLQRALVAYWPGSEASGPRRDLGPNGLTLTDNNTVTGNTGPGTSRLTLASQFTAANSESLSRANEALLQLQATDFTLMARVYADSISADRTIIAKRNSGGTNAEYLITLDVASNQIAAYLGAGGAHKAAGAISTATWYHIVLTRQGTSYVLYLNNAANAFTDANYTADDTNAFALGVRSASEYWDGRMCDVGVWRRKLSAQEVAYLYDVNRPFP